MSKKAIGDISVNRKALRDYHILDRLEAGVELKGTEVKSIRAGLANINSGFVRIENEQAWLYEVDIQPYEKASHEQHEPRRVRKLLLHRQEIDRLFSKTRIEGCTLIALRMFWKGHRVKIEVGLGKGKLDADKREDIKARTENREAARVAAEFNKRRG